MRKASGYLAILFSIALLLLATAGANFAWADPPGNNGTVKIINDRGDSQDDPDNDPHVCIFHIYGFNFDANQSGTWDIAAWPPGGGPLAATQSHGNWKAGADGKFDAHPSPTGTTSSRSTPVWATGSRRCSGSVARAHPAQVNRAVMAAETAMATRAATATVVRADRAPADRRESA